MTHSESTKRLVTSGLLLALGTGLSFLVIPLPFLYGGSITLFSMVPVVLLSCLYGVKWGLLCGSVYGVLQGVLGATTSQAFVGLQGGNVLLMVLLDYLLAFMVLGLGGIFCRQKKTLLRCVSGSILATFLRYICHFLSGYLLWSSYAERFFSDVMGEAGAFFLNRFSGKVLAVLYSLLYNGAYMVPEIILSAIGLAAVLAVPQIKRLVLR